METMQAYKLKSDGLEPAGTIAIRFPGYDYGIASDDTAATGREHISLTKNLYGAYPSFSHPVDDLEEVQIDHLPVVDDDHARDVCKMGQGAECCKFLTMGTSGWSCEKLSSARMQLEYREGMISKGDNCPGRRSR